ncbi:hypothetical protein CTA2_1250 [Colletotrichum tanaceti]|uniref:NmrA-like domain-containing protein n=1 Tax=Colletotrichum tanaceti TaxID=1306861 RepID=A0A4U6XHQ5_9PEZI|nr:hypothetical protein CTA2_1250 [Colletotrichum tanaceti]TKW55468.1 hypothetical protein CTA1_3553 [Colletotrichum tanaceti]
MLTLPQKGYLGSAILKEFVEGGFNASVLGRSESAKEGLPDGEIEYTIFFSVGGFADLSTQIPAAFDFSNKSITMYDDGVHPFSVTSVASIGKAVVGALKNPDATKNRNLKIHELIPSQAQLTALAKMLSPPGTQWRETKLDGKAEWDNALKAVLEDPCNEQKVIEIIKNSPFSRRYESAFGKVENKLVGVPLLTEKDLEEKMAAAFRF